MPLFRHKEPILALLIVIVTFMAFQPMLRHEFLNIDDPVYVTDNVYVKNGLCLESVQWAFSTLHAEFYHPLTWLSLMLDTDLYGVNPAGYLSSNLILHVLNSLLLLAVFVKMTHLPLASFFVALLFAIHPLHIESVAWIAERKDVLSTFFWMLTLWCYISLRKQAAQGSLCCRSSDLPARAHGKADAGHPAARVAGIGLLAVGASSTESFRNRK